MDSDQRDDRSGRQMLEAAGFKSPIDVRLPQQHVSGLSQLRGSAYIPNRHSQSLPVAASDLQTLQ